MEEGWKVSCNNSSILLDCGMGYMTSTDAEVLIKGVFKAYLE
jgi:hypothetical protein